MENGVNVDEDNFSLYRLKVKDIIKGTACANKRRSRMLEQVSPLVESQDKRFDSETQPSEDIPVAVVLPVVVQESEKKEEVVV